MLDLNISIGESESWRIGSSHGIFSNQSSVQHFHQNSQLILKINYLQFWPKNYKEPARGVRIEVGIGGAPHSSGSTSKRVFQ